MVADGLAQLEIGTTKLDSSMELIINKLADAQATLQNSNISFSILQLQQLASKNEETINMMITSNPTLAYLYVQYKTTDRSDAARAQILANVPTENQSSINILFLLDANNIALNQTISSLNEVSTQVNGLMNNLTEALSQIKEGTSNISDNVTIIKNGVDKLYNGSITLLEGVNTLDGGIQKLSNGIITFNEQGINKLNNYVLKAKSYSDRLQRLVNLSNEYNGFVSNNSESTIFIYKVAK